MSVKEMDSQVQKYNELAGNIEQGFLLVGLLIALVLAASDFLGEQATIFFIIFFMLVLGCMALVKSVFKSRRDAVIKSFDTEHEHVIDIAVDCWNTFVQKRKEYLKNVKEPSTMDKYVCFTVSSAIMILLGSENLKQLYLRTNYAHESDFVDALYEDLDEMADNGFFSQQLCSREYDYLEDRVLDIRQELSDNVAMYMEKILGLLDRQVERSGEAAA